MRILVTGGAGFIGSHLCSALIAQKEKITIFDNLSSGDLKNVSNFSDSVSIIQGDIRNETLIESLVEKSDLIIHLAAAVGVTNILQNPVDAISTNYFGSKIVLDSALKENKRIIISSTSEIYGKNPNQPLSESDDRVIGTPQKLRWTYSDAKALEESHAHFLFVTQGLKVTTLRLFNTVGPRQTGRYGMVLPRFIDSALQEKPITVYGNGNQSRTFCHVEDVVNAFLKVIDNEATIGEVFNIGGNEEITINELANKVKIITKSNSEIKYLPYIEALPAGYEDIVRRIPNVSKINKFTNWKAVKKIDDIIKEIVQYKSTEIS
jgi:UDP-glucose 4-epimerase